MKTQALPTTGDQRAHFGTIKRQWGYNHTNLTGLESKWRTQPIMLVYNIKRSINILGVPDLIAKLKNGTHLQDKSLVLLKTKYIKLQLDFIFIKLNLQPKRPS
jgi:hypothetical protein